MLELSLQVLCILACAGMMISITNRCWQLSYGGSSVFLITNVFSLVVIVTVGYVGISMLDQIFYKCISAFMAGMFGSYLILTGEVKRIPLSMLWIVAVSSRLAEQTIKLQGGL